MTHETMASEFDTVASWTADVALDLGADYYIPAGCRGSGNPSALEWLMDAMLLGRDDDLLDVGSGVGGPAALAEQRVGARPILLESEPGGCRAAARLFGFPVVLGDALRLPFGSGQFQRVWCLGVLCTTQDHHRMMSELGRVLAPNGRLGMLVFAATTGELSQRPQGNNFPDVQSLESLAGQAGLEVVEMKPARDLPAPPPGWVERTERVDAELNRLHFEQDAWKTAQLQSRTFGALLDSGELESLLLVLQRRH